MAKVREIPVQTVKALNRPSRADTGFFETSGGIGAHEVRSGLMVILDFLVLLVFGFRGRLFEVFNGLAHTASDFRQFSDSEYDQNNNEYDDEFRHSYTKHVRLLLGKSIRPACHRVNLIF